jgi:hypothetical protein
MPWPLSPPLAPATPFPGPFPACSRARAPARPVLSLSLTDEPSPPVSRPIPRLARDHPHWQCGPACQPLVVFPAVPSSRSPPAIASVPSPVFSPHREVWHRSVLPPLTSVLAGTAPPWCLIDGAVRHLWAALCKLTGTAKLHRSPFPRAPIKGPPRAPPSPHRPRPFLSSLVRAQSVEKSPPSSSSPVSHPSLLPAPLLVHQAIAWAP